MKDNGHSLFLKSNYVGYYKFVSYYECYRKDLCGSLDIVLPIPSQNNLYKKQRILWYNLRADIYENGAYPNPTKCSDKSSVIQIVN